MLQVRNKSDIVLSKRLSYLLRHGALKEGLSIKPNGFVPLHELLCKSLHGYTYEDIRRVVENNEKQRFTLSVNDNVLEIRANQGHSIHEIDNLALKLVENAEFDIIHGTYLKCWHKIKIQGLSRMNRNHIHFAKGLNLTNGLRKGAEVFIYIDFPSAKESGLIFCESENGVILCAGNAHGFIETKYFLKVISKDGQKLQMSNRQI